MLVLDQSLFVCRGVDGKIARNPDGGLGWLDQGPREDVEFMNCLNRHPFFDVLLDAWNATGNPVYAAKINGLVIDWVLHLPCSPCVFLAFYVLLLSLPGDAHPPIKLNTLGDTFVDKSTNQPLSTLGYRPTDADRYAPGMQNFVA